jgi:hypothetical protein
MQELAEVGEKVTDLNSMKKALLDEKQPNELRTRSASMVAVILRRKRASLMFSPTVSRISSSVGEIITLFFTIFPRPQWLIFCSYFR